MTLTTKKLVDAKMRETRLGEDDVLRLVARAAMVRQMSISYPNQFVLKGGALLFHVYGGPRASFVDTDLADPSTKSTVPDVQDTLEIKGQDGFSLEAKNGQWTTKGEILKGSRIPFSVHDFQSGRRNRTLTVSVSVRKAEVLDPIEPVTFNASDLLAEGGRFEVLGLSLNELAAEKILGWCCKEDLFKHFSDLALLARDKSDLLDPDKIIDLVQQKFREEKQASASAGLYRQHGLIRPSDLNSRFATDARLADVRKQWDSELDQSIWLIQAERARPGDSLTDPEVVIEKIQEFWVPIVEQL